MTRAQTPPWFFDAWSRVYDLGIVQRLTYAPVQDAVVRRLRQRTPARVLDLGCGTGILAARLRAEWPGAQIVGADLSAGMLRAAATRDARLALVRTSALALPFRAGAFDTVVSTEAFHWFPDQARALAECARVLVPGGRLLVALVNPPVALVGDAAAVLSALVGQPFRWPTRGRMRVLLERAGFVVEAQESIFRVPAGLLLPPVLSVARRPVVA